MKIKTPSIEERKHSAKAGIDLIWKEFPYETHTFQYMNPEKKPASIVKVFSKDEKLEALAQSIKYNNDSGYNVYFMANPGDGVIHREEGKKTARSTHSVQTLQQCFIDTDECKLSDVQAYLAFQDLQPHLIVESSPARYHVYFHFIPVQKTDSAVKDWKAVQQMLHRLGKEDKEPADLGLDSSMHDYSKVLRVPGFTHIAKFSTVKLHQQSNHKHYTLNELFKLTEGQKWLDHNASKIDEHGYASSSTVPEYTGPVITSGQRFEKLQALSLSLANNASLKGKQKAELFHKFIVERIDNKDGTYYDSKLNRPSEKASALLHSAIDKVKREKLKKIQVIDQALDEALEDKPAKSPWELPDEFYLKAPNGFGDVIKQVVEYSMYPHPALAFGTFLTGLSIIRARNTFTPGGGSPALYTLIVADSGAGKGDPMLLLSNLFSDMKLKNLIQNDIRSERGIYEHLDSNNSLGIFLYDEIAAFLSSVQKKDALVGQAYIGRLLLSFYSLGAKNDHLCGKVAKGGKALPEIILHNPMLAICGFTTPIEFNNLFTSESIQRGLFQRFIPIVLDDREVYKNRDAANHKIIKSALFERDIAGIAELDKETDFEEEQQQQEVSPIQNPVRTKALYTPQALKRFLDMEDEYRSKMYAIKKIPERAHLAGLYTRVTEQMERIATTLSPGGEIELSTLEYAAEFMESRHKAVMESCEHTVLGGDGAKEIQREAILLSTLSRLSKTSGLQIVMKSTLYDSVRRHYRDSRDFEQAIKDAEAANKIQLGPFKFTPKCRKGTIWLKLSDVLS